jgi:hypothetical protein
MKPIKQRSGLKLFKGYMMPWTVKNDSLIIGNEYGNTTDKPGNFDFIEVRKHFLPS